MLSPKHKCECKKCQKKPRSKTARRHREINVLFATLDEKQRRLTAAMLANERGETGVEEIALITGLNPKTIQRGIEELASEDIPEGTREEGAGRPSKKKIPDS